MLDAVGANGGGDDDGGDGDTHCLHQQRAEVQPGDGGEIAGFDGFIGGVLDTDGEGTDEDGQHLPGGGERDGERDAGTHFLFAGDDEDGGDDGGERRVRGDGGADIHPAERHHFEGAADHDAGGHVAQCKPGEGTGDERAVRLKFVENRAHAGEAADEEDEDDL